MVRSQKAANSYVALDRNSVFLLKQVKVKVPHVSKQHLRWFHFGSQPAAPARKRQENGLSQEQACCPLYWPCPSECQAGPLQTGSGSQHSTPGYHPDGSIFVSCFTPDQPPTFSLCFQSTVHSPYRSPSHL